MIDINTIMTSIQRISFDFPNTQRISVFRLAPGQTEYEDGKQRGTNASLSPPSVGQSGLCKQGSASSVDTVTVVVWQR